MGGIDNFKNNTSVNFFAGVRSDRESTGNKVVEFHDEFDLV